MARLIRSSTCATPRFVVNSTESSLTESSSDMGIGRRRPDRAARAADARIQHVAEPVAQEIEAHHGEEDGEARRGGIPPGIRQELARLRNRASPFGRRRGGPEPEETEPRP